MKIKVYKAVRRSDGGWWSFCSPFKWELKYEIGVETKARESTKILCFENLKDAERLVVGDSGHAILECETDSTPVKVERMLAYGGSSEELREFWSSDKMLFRRDVMDSTFIAPEGTVGVDNLTPIRRVC